MCGESLFLFCGKDTNNHHQPLNIIQKLDLAAQSLQWRPLDVTFKDCETWTSRDTCGAFAYENKIVIFGGNSGWLSESYELDVTTMEMTKGQPLIKAEEFINCQPAYGLRDRVYLVGELDKDLHVYRNSKWYLVDIKLVE